MQQTILLVDDDQHLLTVIAALLTRMGYRVLKADGGQSAVQVWKDHQAPVDLLFTDVHMPGMNGAELAAALMALQPGLKVLYTSGVDREDVAHLFSDPAPARLLKKPASLEQLREGVRRAITGE